MTDTSPVQTETFSVPGQATAATDTTVIMDRVDFTATVASVTYAPNAAITGQNTNPRRVALINRGSAGAGTTVIAELTFVSGVNGVAGDELTITLSATAADRVVTQGDVLAWFSDAVLTGLADPGGLVTVGFQRTYG
jgi:hypothetical protein